MKNTAKNSKAFHTLAATPKAVAAGKRPLVVRKVVGASGIVRVEYGGVTVVVPEPTKSELKKRVSESKSVVKRIAKAASSPGVRLMTLPTTPMYSADPKNVSFVIRKVGHQVTRGMFRNGRFVEVA